MVPQTKLKIAKLLKNVGMVFLHVSVCVAAVSGSHGGQKVIRFRVGVKDNWEMPCGC